MYVCMYVCMYGWMDRWVDGWLAGWVGGWAGGWHQRPSRLLYLWIGEQSGWRATAGGIMAELIRGRRNEGNEI